MSKHPVADMYLADRERGMNASDIARKYGVSRATVHQVIHKHCDSYYHIVQPHECIYVGLRKWMNENEVSGTELCRRMGSTSGIKYVGQLSSAMRGMANLRKDAIDKLIAVTGMKYEELFTTD